MRSRQVLGSPRGRIEEKAPLRLQAKREFTSPGDVYEQEAERVAGQVTSLPQPGRATLAPLQTWHSPGHEALSSSGQPLAPSTRELMEPRFGHDFSRVRVHSDRAAANAARAVGARAYALGHDIVFGSGEYAPGTAEGRRLLAHELTHVVQQAGSPGGLIQTRSQLQIARQPLHPAAEDDLVDKFAELYARLPEKVRQRLLARDTVAVGIALDSDGEPRLVYTVAGNRRYPALAKAADEVGFLKWEPNARTEGRGSVGAPGDAEQLMLEGNDEEMRVVAIAASRKICKDCGPAMKDAGVHVVDPQKFLSRLKTRLAAAPPPTVGVAPKTVPVAPGEDEAVEAIPTPPVGKAPKPGKPPSAPAAGAVSAGDLAGPAALIAITMIGQRYIQGIYDELNAQKYAQYMKDAQPKIQALIEAQAPAIRKLTGEGLAAYGNVTLKVTYMSTPDIQTEIVTTSLTQITVESITISGSPTPAKEEPVPIELSAGEMIRRGGFEIHFNHVLVSYPIKLADSLEEQKQSAEDEIAFFDDILDEIGPEEADDEMQSLLADREAGVARRSRIEAQQAEIRQRQEKRREEEEKAKQKQAVRKYESLRKEPEPKVSHGDLLPGPAGVRESGSAEFSPLSLPGADKVGKADGMSRVFVAEKEKLVAWAERLRASASAGKTGTPEYAISYQKFTAMRDPWPGQIRQSLDWLRKNVPAAGQAIGRMEALADWLKTGGWETLKQVSKP